MSLALGGVKVAKAEEEGAGNRLGKDESFTEEELEAVEETVAERLMGLTEMVPDRAWSAAARMARFSYWLVRRGAWVLGTSMALLVLPSFIEQQRTEFEEMQKMQKKQLMFGQGTPGLTPPPSRLS